MSVALMMWISLTAFSHDLETITRQMQLNLSQQLSRKEHAQNRPNFIKDLYIECQIQLNRPNMAPASCFELVRLAEAQRLNSSSARAELEERCLLMSKSTVLKIPKHFAMSLPPSCRKQIEDGESIRSYISRRQRE